MKKKSVLRLAAGFLLACALFLFGVTSVFAGIAPSPFVPSTGGFDNPIFWVLFNPQPEPPILPMSWSMNNQGELVFTSPYGMNGLQLLFGANGNGSFSSISSMQTSNGFNFTLLNGNNQDMYNAVFTFASNGIDLFPGSLVAFNPQPEPPGAPGLSNWFTFDLAPSPFVYMPLETGDVVDMTMRLEDINGNLVSLEPASVPEPSTLLLLGAGLVGLGFARKRMTKT